MVAQQPGTVSAQGSGVLLSGTVPPLADAYYPRDHSGPDLGSSVRPGETVVLVHGADTELAPVALWHTYMLLTRVEAAFRNLKTDLCVRPIFHHKEARADAHVWFAVLAYALSVTIQLRHRGQGGADANASDAPQRAASRESMP